MYVRERGEETLERRKGGGEKSGQMSFSKVWSGILLERGEETLEGGEKSGQMLRAAGCKHDGQGEVNPPSSGAVLRIGPGSRGPPPPPQTWRAPLYG